MKSYRYQILKWNREVGINAVLLHILEQINNNKAYSIVLPREAKGNSLLRIDNNFEYLGHIPVGYQDQDGEEFQVTLLF